MTKCPLCLHQIRYKWGRATTAPVEATERPQVVMGPEVVVGSEVVMGQESGIQAMLRRLDGLASRAQLGMP